MLQRLAASLLCVLGAAALALGIASATVWRADDVLVAVAEAADGTTMIVTDPGVLDLAADQVTITATVSRGAVVIALGRSADVDAWVGTDPYTRVTGLATWDELATDEVAEVEPTVEPTAEPTTVPTDGATAAAPTAEPTVEPTVAPTPEPTAGPADDEAGATDATAPDPSGSDLWVRQAGGRDHAIMELTPQDGRWSILVAATTAGVTPQVSLAWPQVVTTPWLVPGVVVGGLLLVAGLVWWMALLVGARRRRRRPVEAPAPTVAVAGTDPGAPVTRRQLRELEEQRRRGHHPEVRASAASTGDAAEGSRRANRAREATASTTPAASSSPAGPTASWSPTGPTGPTGPMAAPAESRRARRAAEPRTAEPRTAEPKTAEPKTAEPKTAEPKTAEPKTAEPRTLRRFGRRRPEVPVAEPVEAPEAAPPVVEPRSTPAASADAWRRTWGLGASSPEPGPDSTPPTAQRPEGGAR